MELDIFLFYVLGDNFIDKEEYTTVYTGYGLAQEDCHKAFEKFQQVRIQTTFIFDIKSQLLFLM